MQPNAASLTLNANEGYADQLYAIEKCKLPGQPGDLGEATGTGERARPCRL